MRSGRPESVPTASEAAAGARVCLVSALHGTAGAADGLYGMLGSPGIPGGNERRRRSSGARSSPAMADGGFGCSWGGGYRAQSKGGKREGRRRSSQRCRRDGWPARGRAGVAESTEKLLGGRRGENVGGGVPGLLWSRDTTRRSREDRRSFLGRWRG